MIERGQGRIINVASEAGLFSINTGSAYCVSKAALIRLAESTAIETEAYGIAVRCTLFRSRCKCPKAGLGET